MAVNGFTFFYGNYEHPKGEVYPKTIEVRPMPNADGVRWASQYRMQVAGDFCTEDYTELTVAQISARIQALDNAYLFDYKDCGFRDPDGNLTPHYMATDDIYNLSGNKVVHRSWDNVMPTEYANTRSFAITIQALFQENYSEILAFRESTSKQGTGGPVTRTYNLWDGTPYKEIIHNTSKVYHIQTGTLIGMSTWPDPLVYSPPYWPQEELVWRRMITQTTPRFHGHPSFLKGTHYRTDYTYFFERPSAAPLNINPWV